MSFFLEVLIFEERLLISKNHKMQQKTLKVSINKFKKENTETSLNPKYFIFKINKSP